MVRSTVSLCLKTCLSLKFLSQRFLLQPCPDEVTSKPSATACCAGYVGDCPGSGAWRTLWLFRLLKSSTHFQVFRHVQRQVWRDTLKGVNIPEKIAIHPVGEPEQMSEIWKLVSEKLNTLQAWNQLRGHLCDRMCGSCNAKHKVKHLCFYVVFSKALILGGGLCKEEYFHISIVTWRRRQSEFG